jgi:hypothetical protein
LALKTRTLISFIERVETVLTEWCIEKDIDANEMKGKDFFKYTDLHKLVGDTSVFTLPDLQVKDIMLIEVVASFVAKSSQLTCKRF